MEFRIGQGYDVHRIAEGLPMTLCGVRIECGRGFVAHSDGDVAIHALCDALLGSLALGDIGHLFPDTSDEFAGIDSRILLSRVVGLVRSQGWEPVNADVTIALQAPKVAPYIAASASRPRPPKSWVSWAAERAAKCGPWCSWAGNDPAPGKFLDGKA